MLRLKPPLLLPVLAAALVALVAAPPGARAQRTDPPDVREAAASEDGETPSETGGLDYRVSYAGELPEDLQNLIDSVSELEDKRDRLPATPAALRRRVEDERARIEAALRSVGYYAFELTSDVDTSTAPAQVTIDIEPGPVFTLASYEVVYRPEAPRQPSASGTTIPRRAEDLDLKIGMPAQAAPLKAAVDRIQVLLGRAGYPYAEVTDTRYLADHADSTLAAEVVVETGPQVSFGPLSVSGLEEVEKDYIVRLAQWPEGQVWDQRKLNAVRERVSGTDLFDTVVLDYPDDPPPGGGALPVEMVLREQAHRTVGVGAEVTTSDEVARATASWEHRNLFGRGEQLTLEALGSFLRQEVRGTFRRPDFMRLDQDLIARSSLRREESDAFTETTAAVSLGVIREIDEDWTVELNTAYELTEQKDAYGTDRFSLVGLPGVVTYDTRDDLLNPTKGLFVETSLAPWTSFGGRASQFLVTDVVGSTYWAPFETDRVVFAARGRIGSLFFENAPQVPASKRFYAGGGGSVRGYDFRALGPQDEDGDPVGGKSVVELGLETRIKVTDDIGVVPFLDGGQVYPDTFPDADFDWQWAAGVGFRYYLGIGPVRLDVAFPLNGRDQDDFFEFYLSIGQAF
jgi:translocation and assembly module TamA